MRGEKYVDVADAYGWPVRQGEAAFAGTPDAPVLEVTAADGTVETIEAAHYLVATGSRPWVPPIEGLDGVEYLTSTTAMELSEVPSRCWCSAAATWPWSRPSCSPGSARR